MLWIIRILLTLPAAFAGHDVLDLGFAGTAAVFVIIIGFAIWATGRFVMTPDLAYFHLPPRRGQCPSISFDLHQCQH